MHLQIHTHLDITPDILFNVGEQIKNGFNAGKVPFRWELQTDDEFNKEFGNKEELEEELDEIIDSVHKIKNNYNID